MNIWVPPSFTDRKPKHVCRLCGERFLTPEGQERHVAKHYRTQEAEVRMLSMRERHPYLFGDGNVDVEYEKWGRQRGSGKRD